MQGNNCPRQFLDLVRIYLVCYIHSVSVLTLTKGGIMTEVDLHQEFEIVN